MSNYCKECFKRQEKINRLQEENEKLKAENEQLKKPCLVMPKVNQLAVPIEEFKKLQQENEELKKKKDEYYLRTLDYETKISYLIQALEEIRHFIQEFVPEKEDDYNSAKKAHPVFFGLLEQIKYNCNEVLNDRD